MTNNMPTAINSRSAGIDAAAIDYCAGLLSVNAVANKHGIPESTLRREAKRRGWIRDTLESHRKKVASSLAGEPMANEVANDSVTQAQAAAVAQDVEDMNSGLAVARQVIRKLLPLVDQVEDPRDLKVIVEANRAAIETIRKIRALDEPPPSPVAHAVSMTVTDGIDELREAFSRVLNRHAVTGNRI